MSFENYVIPYQIDERYKKKVAYFSMEYAIE
jgi:starch phosphorylase